MKQLAKNQGTNEKRTKQYFENWDLEKTLKTLITKENPCIFDVGANNGSSINEFKGWWPKSIVHCFEPQAECYESLRETADLYAPDSVVLNMTAVGNHSAVRENFYTHSINSGISGFNRINTESKDSIKLKELNSKGGDAKQIYAESLNSSREVSVIRLDEYIESVDPSLHIDFLKIDTQGYEPEVLEGLGVKLMAVDVILTELMFFDFYERSLSFSDIEQHLLKFNFSIYDISHISKNPMNGRTDWVDVIYVSDRILQK